MNSELETLVSLDTLINVSDEAAQEINALLRSGIEAAKTGSRDEAKALLFRVTDIDPENEMAWLWLASVSEYPEELLTFLQKVLTINPENEQALEWESSTKGLLARNLVQYGITAVQENKKESARRCFLRALETDRNNEMAWLWMASITDDVDEKTANLKRVLDINPQNEVANTLLNLQRKNEAQELLQKSKTSAVKGDRREALEILEQVKQLDADLDEVWILQAHLSDSFEEKAFCFKQALACDPGNVIARVGLASLESILQAVNGNGHGNGTQSLLSPELEDELKADEEADYSAEFSDEYSDENIETDEFVVEESFEPEAVSFSEPAEEAAIEEPENAFPSFAEDVSEPEEFFEETNSFADATTGELEHPVIDEEPALVNFAENSQEIVSDENMEEPVAEESIDEPAVTYFAENAEEVMETAENFSDEDKYAETETQTVEGEESEAEIKAHTFYFGQEEIEETIANFEEQQPEGEAPVAAAEEFDSPANDSEVPEEINEEMQISQTIPEQAAFVQMSVCPFCAAENNINDEVCGGCHAVLGLHNLDMLFSHTGADKEKISEAVENMETSLESDSFSAEEYFNLGLACLNLRDLDAGLSYLQKSYILNPTNSFLKSQIDELAKRVDKHEGEAQNSTESGVTGKTVMVVDDSATIRKLVSAKLEKHGHSVISAVDGMDALAKLEEIVPDLILLDITMPRLDGYQVCKLIRANENTRFVPIVLISGKDGFFDKMRGKMCGSTTYITKPFGPEMLLRTVEAYFE
jgi:CheY-like chemotaxis protein/Tfp pilus assembly protein PilF